jgi:hypothetical protein
MSYISQYLTNIVSKGKITAWQLDYKKVSAIASKMETKKKDAHVLFYLFYLLTDLLSY